MTEDVIKMAREAHVVPYIVGPQNTEYLERLERFSELVEAEHTERLLAGVEMPEPFAYAASDKYGNFGLSTKKNVALRECESGEGIVEPLVFLNSVRFTVAAAVLREREECAKVADRHSTCANDTPNVIAVAIRARGTP